MGTSVGVGFSFSRNPAEAGRQAARGAMEQAGIERPDFVLVFATVGYDQQRLIDAVNAATGGAPLSGCSGEGIITRDVTSETNFGVTVMPLASDEIRFNNSCVTDLEGQLADSGRRLAEEISPFLAAEPIACLVFADGLIFNFDLFMSTFESTLPGDGTIPILGGMAADNWATRKTYQYHNDRVFSGGIACVAISGKGSVISAVHHGCIPVGGRHTVTRSRENIIFEIDGIPALEALKDLFDEEWRDHWNRTSINLCLGIKAPESLRDSYEEYIVRYMVTKNDRDDSVMIQSNIAEGTDLWVMRRDNELIRDGLQTLSARLKSELGDRKPKFIIQFECAGRGKVLLRERLKIELITSLQRELGGDIPWIGFYGYGEIGPVAGRNCFHNFTTVISVIY